MCQFLPVTFVIIYDIMISGPSKLACEGATKIMNEVHDIMIGGPSKLACEGATKIMNEVHDIMPERVLI